jgi:hypothetical protein
MFFLLKRWQSPVPFLLLWLTCVVVSICLASRPTQEEAKQLANILRAIYLPRQRSSLETSLKIKDEPKQPECPPCFNCHLPVFHCSHFANCSDYDGKCSCTPGFGGEDCSKPVCNSLADGPNRRPREKNEVCECSEGWEGINCNG